MIAFQQPQAEQKEDGATNTQQEQYKKRVESNLSELHAFVTHEQTGRLQQLGAVMKRIDDEENKVIQNATELVAKCKETKQEIPRQAILNDLQVIAKNRDYVKANIDFLQSGFDEKLLKQRIEQMHERLSTVKLKEKTPRTPWDAYNSIFDLSSTTAKTLKKNHCSKCDHPLIGNKRHALLQCPQCARATEQLIPLTSPHQLNHSNAQSLSARMAGVGCQKINPQDAKRSKAVLSKLQQFRVGEMPISTELLISVKDKLRKKDHINAAFVALPTPVADALKELKKTEYLPYKDKIANMINGIKIQELTDAQINEITARLKVVQMMFRFLRNDAQDHIYINFFVNRICNMLGWKQLANLFPTQRTSSTLKTHMDTWRTLINFLQCFDSNFQWQDAY